MKSDKGLFIYLICLLFLFTSAVQGQLGNVARNAKDKPTLVILGTYHMGTPGNNIYNGKVDDIASPERQKQIVELVERLKKFTPTKVVVECDWDKDIKLQEIYNQYLDGSYQLSKNETNQIGFRLAKESGLKKVNCVDWSDFWDDPNINYGKYAAKDAELDAFVKKFNEDLKIRIDAEDAKLSKLSVIGQLALLNQPSRMETDHQSYFDIMRIGCGNEYVGAGYLSWWYRRNLVILDNIIRLTDSPKERILVIYGVGHLKLLTQFANESGFYNVQSPLKYLGSKD